MSFHHQSAGAETDTDGVSDGAAPTREHTRRTVVLKGMKLAFVAPVVSTFLASDAYANNYSCYPAGHACPGAEVCCNAACNLGVCPP